MAVEISLCSGDRRSRENKLLDVGRRSKSCKTKTVCTWTLRTDKHKGFHLSQTLLLIVLTCSLFGVPQFKNQVEVFLTYIQDNKKQLIHTHLCASHFFLTFLVIVRFKSNDMIL